MSITCELELGRWTIRVNGTFIWDFSRWREGAARRMTMRLQQAIALGKQPVLRIAQ